MLYDPHPHPNRHWPTRYAVALALTVACGQAGAATLVVMSTADSIAIDGACTLREAITAVNAGAAVNECTPIFGAFGTADAISFAIDAATDPGCNATTGVCRINVTTDLPTLTQTVSINGYSQPGASPNTQVGSYYPNAQGLDTQLRIELDGSPAGYVGLSLIGADNSQVRGLSIVGFSTGIWVTSASAIIAGNFIGVRADGATTVSSDNGIAVGGVGGGATIGMNAAAPLAADRNLISGNLNGIVLDGVHGNHINGNLMGTDITGTLPRAPSQVGIQVIDGVGNDIIGNVIASDAANNSHYGVDLRGTISTTVVANSIGIGVGGVALGWGAYGVYIHNSPNQTALGNAFRDNGIAHSGLDGVSIASDPADGDPLGNYFLDNRIFANAGLGINLQPVGESGTSVHTVNDAAPDADTGPNGLQNHPVITAVTLNSTGGVDIAFNLTSAPNEDYRISAYANDACDASGYGEGQYPSGVTSPLFTTNAAGTLSAVFTVPAPLPTGWSLGQAVTLLAQNASTIDTSEFSRCSKILAGASDTTPNVFSFVDVTGAAVSTLYVSNPIVVTGVDAATPISVSGGEYRINAGSWTTAAGSVMNGDSVDVRVTSSALANTTTSATLTIGGMIDSYDVRTAADSSAPNAIASVPTLSSLGLGLLSLLLAGLSAVRSRPRRPIG